jgi:hypothetical protein
VLVDGRVQSGRNGLNSGFSMTQDGYTLAFRVEMAFPFTHLEQDMEHNYR